MSGAAALDAHLAEGITRVCRCWRLTRRDGVVFGFTDHDRTLVIDGVVFRADTGMTAATVSQTSGLSVDNSETIGAFSDAAIARSDIVAGRFDHAQVEVWIVQWDAPENRVLQFRGSLGELTRSGDAFRAELRGLSEAINTPTGRVYNRACDAVLGDRRCAVDLSVAAYRTEVIVQTVEAGRVFTFEGMAAYEDRWFERGQFLVLSGEAEGLAGAIKLDRDGDTIRHVELWDRLGAAIEPGDRVQLTAGCDKRMKTCRLKFGNVLNFRGFPDIPGTDWLLAHPSRVTTRSGGSRR